MSLHLIQSHQEGSQEDRLQIWKTYSAHVTESRVRKKEVRGHFGKTDITAHTLLSLLSPSSSDSRGADGKWLSPSLTGKLD